MTRASMIRVAVLVLLVLAAGALIQTYGLPDVDALRQRVSATGAAAPLVFVLGYAVLVLVPSPAGLLTIAGGALFGVWAGSALVLAGALLGAVISFEAGRLLGRDAVAKLTGGRLQRVDRLLGDHGLAAVLTVRLLPVLPFTALNYAAGLSGVGRRDYVLGSAVGMLPGVVAYTAVGAYGSDPWKLTAAVAALVLLVLASGAWGRRLVARSGAGAGAGAEVKVEAGAGAGA